MIYSGDQLRRAAYKVHRIAVSTPGQMPVPVAIELSPHRPEDDARVVEVLVMPGATEAEVEAAIAAELGGE